MDTFSVATFEILPMISTEILNLYCVPGARLDIDSLWNSLLVVCFFRIPFTKIEYDNDIPRMSFIPSVI